MWCEAHLTSGVEQAKLRTSGDGPSDEDGIARSSVRYWRSRSIVSGVVVGRRDRVRPGWDRPSRCSVSSIVRSKVVGGRDRARPGWDSPRRSAAAAALSGDVPGPSTVEAYDG